MYEAQVVQVLRHVNDGLDACARLLLCEPTDVEELIEQVLAVYRLQDNVVLAVRLINVFQHSDICVLQLLAYQKLLGELDRLFLGHSRLRVHLDFESLARL